MSKHDVVVVGGGVSGLAFAWHAARAGRSVLVLEQAARPGGCVSTHRTADGFWLELGAHTCYRSYAGLAGLVDALGLRAQVVAREKTHLRFLEGDQLLPGANLGALLRRMSWGELLRHLPRAFTEKKEGQTVYAYYARLVGRRNYGEVLGPMLAAVPSQSADAFPADLLFKRRSTRRQDYPRSFTLRGGLSTLVEALARQPGVEVRSGQAVAEVEAAGEGWAAVTAAGERHAAPVLAVATPPAAAARLLRGATPELAGQVARVAEATVETLGFAVRADRVRLPPSTFLIPREDAFWSVVTRDAVSDPAWRGFAVHFRPGLDRDAKVARAARLLGLAPADLEAVAEERRALPSPVLGHAEVVREVERLSRGTRLAVVGNWLRGLSLEDCVDRAAAEWARVSAG